MKPNETIQTQHEVMQCPACGGTIAADLVIAVELGKPTLAASGGSVEVSANGNLRYFHIQHRCTGKVEADTCGDEEAS